METKISETCKTLSRHAVQTPHHRLIISGQRQAGTTYALIEKALRHHDGKVLFISANQQMSNHSAHMALDMSGGALDVQNHITWDTMSIPFNNRLKRIKQASLIIVDNCSHNRDYEAFIEYMMEAIGDNIHRHIILCNSGINEPRYWNMTDRYCRKYGFINVNVYPYRHPEFIAHYSEMIGKERFDIEYEQRKPNPVWSYLPEPKNVDDVLRMIAPHKDYLFHVRDARGAEHQHIGKRGAQMLTIGGRFHYDWSEIVAFKEVEQLP